MTSSVAKYIRIGKAKQGNINVFNEYLLQEVRVKAMFYKFGECRITNMSEVTVNIWSC